MSELDKRITAWQLSLQPQLGSQSADELEDHLRSIVASLTPTGLSEQECFLIAIHRIGQPALLTREYEKNGFTSSWQTQVAWLLLGLLPLLFLQHALREASEQVGRLFLYSGWSFWTAAVPVLTAHMVSLGLVIVAYTWLKKTMRAHPGPIPQAVRASITPQVALFAAIALLICVAPFMVSRIEGHADWYNLRGIVIESKDLSDTLLLNRIYSSLHVLNFLAIALAITGLILSQRANSKPREALA